MQVWNECEPKVFPPAVFFLSLHGDGCTTFPQKDQAGNKEYDAYEFGHGIIGYSLNVMTQQNDLCFRFLCINPIAS